MLLEDLPRCLEPECTGGGERPADGVYLGHVHMVPVCRECADRAGGEAGTDSRRPAPRQAQLAVRNRLPSCMLPIGLTTDS